MVKASKILSIPIYATTQNASRLGSTVTEIQSILPESTITIDKTAFSMLTPEFVTRCITPQTSGTSPVSGPTPLTVLLVGIETHICCTQTTLDLLRLGHKVYILADGVSSCNANERPVALARLAREGAVVTTSESVLFEMMGDAGSEHFKAVSGLVKETKEATKEAVEVLCRL